MPARGVYNGRVRVDGFLDFSAPRDTGPERSFYQRESGNRRIFSSSGRVLVHVTRPEWKTSFASFRFLFARFTRLSIVQQDIVCVRFGWLSRRTALPCACGVVSTTPENKKSNSALDIIVRERACSRGYTRTEVYYGRLVKPIIVWYYMRVRVPSARRMHEAAYMPPGIRIFTTVNPPLEAAKPVIFERCMACSPCAQCVRRARSAFLANNNKRTHGWCIVVIFPMIITIIIVVGQVVGSLGGG